MKVILNGGPLDGTEVEVPDAAPAYIRVETRRGQVRRTHTYRLHDGRYEFMRTDKRGPPSSPLELDED
jgi:hypothetical protein